MDKKIDDPRRSRRANVLFTASIDVQGVSTPVKLRNLSADGALIEAAKLPAPGTQLTFHRNELSLAGYLAWVDGSHGGIEFAEKLEPQQVMRNVPTPKQRAPLDFRRPGLRTPDLSQSEREAVTLWGRNPSLGLLGE